ncbi:MAG: hypothetical protein ACYCQK_01865 [Acidiferrobacteraceae bacterium]
MAALASALDDWPVPERIADEQLADLMLDGISHRQRQTRPRRNKRPRVWCAHCNHRLPLGSRDEQCPVCGEDALVSSHAGARQYQRAKAREWGDVL